MPRSPLLWHSLSQSQQRLDACWALGLYFSWLSALNETRECLILSIAFLSIIMEYRGIWGVYLLKIVSYNLRGIRNFSGKQMKHKSVIYSWLCFPFPSLLWCWFFHECCGDCWDGMIGGIWTYDGVTGVAISSLWRRQYMVCIYISCRYGYRILTPTPRLVSTALLKYCQSSSQWGLMNSDCIHFFYSWSPSSFSNFISFFLPPRTILTAEISCIWSSYSLFSWLASIPSILLVLFLVSSIKAFHSLSDLLIISSKSSSSMFTSELLVDLSGCVET